MACGLKRSQKSLCYAFLGYSQKPFRKYRKEQHFQIDLSHPLKKNQTFAKVPFFPLRFWLLTPQLSSFPPTHPFSPTPSISKSVQFIWWFAFSWQHWSRGNLRCRPNGRMVNLHFPYLWWPDYLKNLNLGEKYWRWEPFPFLQSNIYYSRRKMI